MRLWWGAEKNGVTSKLPYISWIEFMQHTSEVMNFQELTNNEIAAPKGNS